MHMTNTETITDDQIRALRTEAGQAGDRKMVATCDAALAGSAANRRECALVIAEAESMAADRSTDHVYTRDIHGDLHHFQRDLHPTVFAALDAGSVHYDGSDRMAVVGPAALVPATTWTTVTLQDGTQEQVFVEQIEQVSDGSARGYLDGPLNRPGWAADNAYGPDGMPVL